MGVGVPRGSTGGALSVGGASARRRRRLGPSGFNDAGRPTHDDHRARRLRRAACAGRGRRGGATVSPAAADAGFSRRRSTLRSVLLVSATASGDAQHHVSEGGPRLPGSDPSGPFCWSRRLDVTALLTAGDRHRVRAAGLCTSAPRGRRGPSRGCRTGPDPSPSAPQPAEDIPQLGRSSERGEAKVHPSIDGMRSAAVRIGVSAGAGSDLASPGGESARGPVRHARSSTSFPQRARPPAASALQAQSQPADAESPVLPMRWRSARRRSRNSSQAATPLAAVIPAQPRRAGAPSQWGAAPPGKQGRPPPPRARWRSEAECARHAGHKRPKRKDAPACRPRGRRLNP